MSGFPENKNINKKALKLFFATVGEDIIGATIKNMYTHNCDCSQMYSSYDDGCLFTIEYVTAEGEEKCFSIGNGNIRNNIPTPLYTTYFFGNKETIHYIDNNCGCDDCEDFQKEISSNYCVECGNCIECAKEKISECCEDDKVVK